MTEEAPTYRFWVLDALSGLPLGEFANVSNVSFSDVLNGYGTATLTVPLDDPIGAVFPQSITEKMWIFTFKGPGLIGKCDLLIVRDGVGGAAVAGTTEAVFNGPIVGAQLSLSNRTVTFTANSVYWLFGKRVCDFNRNYKLWDPFDVVRDAWYYATIKAQGRYGFYNFLLDWTTKAKDMLNVYHKVTYGWTVSDGKTLDAVVKDMSADPKIGFDFRIDVMLYNKDPNYMTSAMGQNRVYRALTFGYPYFVRFQPGVLSPATGLIDLDQSFDLDTSATRVWVYGSSVSVGTGTTATSYRKQAHATNSPMLAAGYHLLEETIDKNDVADQALLQSMANASLNLLQPPGWVATATYRPGLLPFNYYQPGDTISVNVAAGAGSGAPAWSQGDTGMLPDGDIQYKVVAKHTTILEDGTESVALTLNNPLIDTSP
jgi:hypothetical protein